jgi:hypothetical protein
MKNAILIFLCFFSLYVLSMGGHGYGGVGTTTYNVTRSIILQRSVAIAPCPWGKFGQDGQFYAQYGIGHSLYNLPFYGIGHVLTKLVPALTPQYERITMFTTLLGQPFISAVTCALLFALCRKLKYSAKTAIFCALLYGLGTQAWMYAQLDFSEPILTFFLLGAVYWIYTPPKTREVSETSRVCRLILAGLFFGIAVTVKVTALMLLPVFLLYVIYGPYLHGVSRLKRILVFLVPGVILGVGIVGFYNLIRFGSPFETGYDHEFNFYYKHVLRQFWNNLFGLEGSIFLYSPVIVLTFFGISRFYRIYKTFALFVFGLILTFFVFYPFTTNELYYGPRYLTPTLPFFMLIAGTGVLKTPGTSESAWYLWRGKIRQWGIGTLLICGIVQQLVGVIVNYHTYYWRIQYTMPVADEAIRSSAIGKFLLATPNLPPILGHLWLLKHGILDLFHPGGLPLAGIQLLSDTTQHNAWIPYYGIDLWWCNPNIIRIAGWIGTGIVVTGLAGMMGFSLFNLMRIIKSSKKT